MHEKQSKMLIHFSATKLMQKLCNVYMTHVSGVQCVNPCRAARSNIIPGWAFKECAHQLTDVLTDNFYHITNPVLKYFTIA